VLIAGGTLGWRWGAAAVGGYVACGVAGAPFFAGGAAGWGVVAGPTGGYLLGFVAGAAVAGLVGRRRWWARAGYYFAALAVIFLCGAFHLAVVCGVGWRAAFELGVAPFIVGDVLKLAVAVAAHGPLATVGRRVFKG